MSKKYRVEESPKVNLHEPIEAPRSEIAPPQVQADSIPLVESSTPAVLIYTRRTYFTGRREVLQIFNCGTYTLELADSPPEELAKKFYEATVGQKWRLIFLSDPQYLRLNSGGVWFHLHDLEGYPIFAPLQGCHP